MSGKLLDMACNWQFPSLVIKVVIIFARFNFSFDFLKLLDISSMSDV